LNSVSPAYPPYDSSHLITLIINNYRAMVGKRAVKSGFDIEFSVARLPTLQDR